MSFAEIVLRVGCALVAWLLVFAHGLALAVIPPSDCSQDLWLGTAILGGFGVIAAALLNLGMRWRAELRWLSVPALALVAYGLYVVAGLLPATFDAIPLCDVKAGLVAPGRGLASSWERAWAPSQIVVLALTGVQSARYWRSS